MGRQKVVCEGKVNKRYEIGNVDELLAIGRHLVDLHTNNGSREGKIDTESVAKN